jgi:hypothetical protein
MRDPSHSKLRTRDIHSITQFPALTAHVLVFPCPHGHLRGPLGTAHGGQEQRLLPERAGVALGPFDVARSSERAGS